MHKTQSAETQAKTEDRFSGLLRHPAVFRPRNGGVVIISGTERNGTERHGAQIHDAGPV